MVSFTVYIFTRLPTAYYDKEKDLADAKRELATVKSIQLELVRHSRLSRRVIKIEKEMEQIQQSHAPLSAQVKQILRIARVRLIDLPQSRVLPHWLLCR